MFALLLRSEIRDHLRRPATWIFFGVFFALAYLLMISAGGAFPGSSVSFSGDRVFVDAPFPVAAMTTLLVFLGSLATAAVVGGAATRDFAIGMHPLVFTTPVSRTALLGSRFVGALVAMFVVFLSIPLGFWVGTRMPFLDAERFGAASAAGFLSPVLTFTLPTLFFTAALFFAVGSLSRRMLPVYLSGVGLLLGYLGAGSLASDISSRIYAAFLDPFGVRPISILTEYWSVAEQNTRLIPLEGVLLWNRLVWVAAGVLALGVVAWRFRMAEAIGGRRVRKAEAAPSAAAPALSIPTPRLETGWGIRAKQFWALMRQEFALVVRSGGFRLLALGGLGFLAINAPLIGSGYGTDTYPVTYEVLDVYAGLFGLFILIIVVFYAGEAVWRERDTHVAGVVDALPVPTVVPLLAKIVALVGVVAVLLGVLMVGGIVTQAILGYTHFEIGLYLTELFAIQLSNWALVVVFAVAVHAIVDRKAAAHVLLIGYIVASSFLSQFGLEHMFWSYGATPPVTYSDMNGYARYALPIVSFNAYWAAWALLLAVAAGLFWRRGPEDGWRTRARLASQRFTRPAQVTAALGAVAVLVLGGFVLYNTDALHTRVTVDQQQERQADYERLFKRYEGVPQPTITAVALDVDLYPRRGRADVDGRYWAKNESPRPIDSLHVRLGETIQLKSLSFGRPYTTILDDRPLGYAIYRLQTPLQPGDSLDVRFRVAIADSGFTNSGAPPRVAENGAFLNSGSLPAFGYDRGGEIESVRDRRTQGLPERPAMRDPEDPLGRSRTYISGDAHWIRFEATVSTDADQTALAPGVLVREWTDGGRRHFQYRAPAPMLWFASFLSGRYDVHRADWTGADGRTIPIEIFYHPAHAYNLARMTASVGTSLDYYTRAFGPYPFGQVRIVEFPRYQSFAQAFQGTIPYSESIGFIARLRDTTDVDYPTFVTAHEMGHQWWAHQLVGADVRGATLLSETLAEYSALMVMKQRVGEAQVRRFLEYDRDAYLGARGQEQDREQPLVSVENQGYVHYQKGGIAMYALQDFVGADKVNAALRRLLEANRFHGPPYPVAGDLVRELKAATPDSLQYLVRDLFERITFYDLRTTAATATPLGNGRTRVSMTIEASKVYVDGLGAETPARMNDWVEIGVLDADEAPLVAQKHRLHTGTNQITVVVRGTPHEAGANPFSVLLDRNKLDDLKKIGS